MPPTTHPSVTEMVLLYRRHGRDTHRRQQRQQRRRRQRRRPARELGLALAGPESGRKRFGLGGVWCSGAAGGVWLCVGSGDSAGAHRVVRRLPSSLEQPPVSCAIAACTLPCPSKFDPPASHHLLQPCTCRSRPTWTWPGGPPDQFHSSIRSTTVL